MTGRIQSLWRHPVKGFTPERLKTAALTAGGYFPCDRIYAVENGPSGFDPAAPGFISKGHFTVLARLAQVARVRTAYDEASGVLRVSAIGRPDLAADLTTPEGRAAFETWLTDFLGDEATGPLKVVQAPGHRFTDHPLGHVSIVNLASVRDLSDKIGRVNLLLCGLGSLLVADLALALVPGLGGVVIGVGLWGLYLGLSQGLLSALVADTAPPDLRGTAFGLFNLATGVALLASSLLAGWLWYDFGSTAAFSAGAVFSGLAILIVAFGLKAAPKPAP